MAFLLLFLVGHLISMGLLLFIKAIKAVTIHQRKKYIQQHAFLLGFYLNEEVNITRQR